MLLAVKPKVQLIAFQQWEKAFGVWNRFESIKRIALFRSV
jgi:hypothetical protein